jgi:hypothetical protein
LAKIERPFGVVLIAVANLPIYVAFVAYALNNYLSLHTSLFDGEAAAMAAEFYTGLIVTYSIVGVIGVLGLLASWKSFKHLAMIIWAVDCVIASAYGYFGGWSEGYFDSSSFIIVSIIFIKIMSIAYLAKKKNVQVEK